MAKRSPKTPAEIDAAATERATYLATVRAARRVATRCGLCLAVIEYGEPDQRRRDVWSLCRGGREVGHWVPGTGHYRMLDEYGGPLAFARVCERLAGTLMGNIPAPQSAAQPLRKTA